MFFFTSRQVGFAALSTLVSLHAVKAQFNFDWSSIEPSEDLVYHDCYGGQKCARLLVPMDWKAAENGEDDDRTVAIAITKLPAVVPTNDTTYGGPIFWNPGGPGGSGVLGQIVLAANLQRISDKPDERHYDIISFDPRGVGFTTPAIDCYPNDPVNRALKDLEAWPSFRRREGHFESFPFTFALTKAFGRRCEGQDILPYVGTPSVARDMIAMVDAIARESEDTNLYGDDDVPRLQYIGFSYGTYLGNVFASLFPGRVGRLVLDGVVDAYDHTTGPGWLKNLVDTDRMYEVFFEGCYDAAENCTLYRSDDSSAKDIQNRVDDLILDLDKAPQVARVVERGEIGRDIVVTGADIRVIFGNAAYSAMVSYPRLAGSIDAAMTGDFSILAPQLVGIEISGQCTPADPTFPNVIEEQGLAIRCVDGDDVTDKDADYWVDYVGQVMEQSDIYGQAIAAGRMWCSGWPVRGSWDYNGPFKTPKANSAGVKGKPLAPTFFMSNRLDPVTPLQAARTMSKEHPGSRVLVVEGEGHCSILSGPSRCRDKLLREYLHTGELPDEKETICEMDCGTWEGCDTAMSDVDQTVLTRHVLGIPLHL